MLTLAPGYGVRAAKAQRVTEKRSKERAGIKKQGYLMLDLK